MKRILFVLIVILVSASIASAQGRDMRRANRQLNRGNLDQAKEHIEAVMEYEEMLEDAELWVLKAKFYIEVALSEDPEYRELADNPVSKADEALKKAEELDTDNQHLLEIQQSMLIMSELVFNEGVEAYNREDMGAASGFFYRAYEYSESFGSKDTTTLYNAALAAELNHDWDKSMNMYKELRKLEYDQPYIYSSLASISLHMGDTLQGTRYIQEGRELYPENLDLIFTEANIHIFTGDVEEADRILNLAIDRDPENPGLYFALGANYDRMAQDSVYSAEDRQFAFEQAVEAYDKALELDPEYFDAVYNLGALYFNEGLTKFELAEERLRATQDFQQYQEDEKEFRENWMEAQPYLERAKDMLDEDDPNYRTVIISLVELYARTNQQDKLQEIEEVFMKYFGDEVEELQEQE